MSGYGHEMTITTILSRSCVFRVSAIGGAPLGFGQKRPPIVFGNRGHLLHLLPTTTPIQRLPTQNHPYLQHQFPSSLLLQLTQTVFLYLQNLSLSPLHLLPTTTPIQKLLTQNQHPMRQRKRKRRRKRRRRNLLIHLTPSHRQLLQRKVKDL